MWRCGTRRTSSTGSCWRSSTRSSRQPGRDAPCRRSPGASPAGPAASRIVRPAAAATSSSSTASACRARTSCSSRAALFARGWNPDRARPAGIRRERERPRGRPRGARARSSPRGPTRSASATRSGSATRSAATPSRTSRAAARPRARSRLRRPALDAHAAPDPAHLLDARPRRLPRAARAVPLRPPRLLAHRHGAVVEDLVALRARRRRRSTRERRRDCRRARSARRPQASRRADGARRARVPFLGCGRRRRSVDHQHRRHRLPGRAGADRSSRCRRGRSSGSGDSPPPRTPQGQGVAGVGSSGSPAGRCSRRSLCIGVLQDPRGGRKISALPPRPWHRE